MPYKNCTLDQEWTATLHHHIFIKGFLKLQINEIANSSSLLKALYKTAYKITIEYLKTIIYNQTKTHWKKMIKDYEPTPWI